MQIQNTGDLLIKRNLFSDTRLSKIYPEPVQFWSLSDPWPHPSSFSFVSLLGVAGWHPGSQTPLSSTPILCLILLAQLCLADPASLPQTDYPQLHFSGEPQETAYGLPILFSWGRVCGAYLPTLPLVPGCGSKKKSPELEWQIEFALRSEKRHHSCLLRSSRQWEQEAKE